MAFGSNKSLYTDPNDYKHKMDSGNKMFANNANNNKTYTPDNGRRIKSVIDVHNSEGRPKKYKHIVLL